MLKWLLMIFGILTAVYGILVLRIGSGTLFWLVWEIIALFFFVWAFFLHRHVFAEHKIFMISFYSMIGVVFVALSILCGMIGSGFSAKGTPDLDYIIVLGAQVRENGPSVVLRYRLDEAVSYLEENPDTICIVSGGKGANEPFSEAEGMEKYLLEQGIDQNRILLEDQSKNTVQNIQKSKNLLENPYDSVGIITNNFHVFRAVQIAKKQGLEDVYGIAADSNVLYLPNNVLRECCGILKDWIMKNLG